MSAKLAAALPADDRNGIGAISASLVDNPDGAHFVVALVDCSRVTTNVDTGDVIPTMRIRAIEGFPGATVDGGEVRRLLRRAYERRTGKFELPLELERALDDLSADETGE